MASIEKRIAKNGDISYRIKVSLGRDKNGKQIIIRSDPIRFDKGLGKKQVHGVVDYGKWVMGGLFMELMADSGKAICDHFGKKITFLNVLRRMSVDCDCAGTSAAEPVIPDLGMMASTDILAIDQASVDMVYNLEDPRKNDLIERIESREGLRQLTAMKELGMGSSQYELVSID